LEAGTCGVGSWLCVQVLHQVCNLAFLHFRVYAVCCQEILNGLRVKLARALVSVDKSRVHAISVYVGRAWNNSNVKHGVASVLGDSVKVDLSTVGAVNCQSCCLTRAHECSLGAEGVRAANIAERILVVVVSRLSFERVEA